MTRVQEDVLAKLEEDGEHILGWWGEPDVTAIVVYGSAIYRYTVDEFGDALKELLTPHHGYSLFGWSMEEHFWQKGEPIVKKEPDNKPSDVVVKNKIKTEKEFKKMAKCDFAKIAQEVNRERFRSWVQDNADDLVTYAEDAFAEAYGSYMDDNCDDYADVAHEAIDNIIDNLYMGDYTDEVEDAEEVVENVIM